MESMHEDQAGSTPSREASRTSKRAAGAQETDSTELAQQSRTDEDEENVRRRAYEIYLSRDGAAGDEADDWFTAEREIRGGRARNDEEESRG